MTRSILAILSVVIVLALWSCRSIPRTPTVPPTTPTPGGAYNPPSVPEGLSRADVIKETNRYRRANGLNPLIENQQLNSAADFKVRDMFARQYSGHYAPDGTSRVKEVLARFGYRYAIAGENIVKGNFRNSADVLLSWMGAPGHRANILKVNFKDIGVATGYSALDGMEVMLSVQIFGTTVTDWQKLYLYTSILDYGLERRGQWRDRLNFFAR